MRALVFGMCVALAACGQSTAPPAAETATAAPTSSALFTYGGGLAPITITATGPDYAPPPTWFICDSIGGDDIFVATRPDEGGAFLFAHYNRASKNVERINALMTGELFA